MHFYDHSTRCPFCFSFGAILFRVLAIFIISGSLVWAEVPLNLSNSSVSICVNASADGMGRFSLSTTGGDPTSTQDDNKPLIYGGLDPWTSYTTVRLDGKNHIFGGQSARRAGKSGIYDGVVQDPSVGNGNIRTATTFGDVEVTQTLSLTRSSTTGNTDTLQIDYYVLNKGSASHSVGLRMILDTMLGGNDGAPFRLTSGPVKQSMLIGGKSIPGFWQAFDSLKAPTIKAQGTLRGNGATVPDSLILSDWGTLADDPWTEGIQGGKGFVRKGEDEPDTAMALVWNPAPLRPGEGRQYTTFYGLGGVTVSSSGDILLGVTSPSEVVLGKSGSGSIPVIAYLESVSPTDMKGVVVSLKLPKNASLQGGSQLERTIKLLPGYGGYQCSWDIIPPGDNDGPIKYEVLVTSGKKVVNRVTRTVNVKVPPSLSLWATGGPSADLPGVVRVMAVVKNNGDRRADDAIVSIRVPKDLVPARNESLTRNVGFIDPGVSVTVTWTFYSKVKGSAVVTINATSTTAKDAGKSMVVKLD